MNAAQNRLYWATWKGVAARLAKVDLSKDEQNEIRKQLTRDVLGRDVSSKDLTDDQLSLVLDAFNAHIGNAPKPRETIGSAKKARFLIAEALAKKGLPWSYAETIWTRSKMTPEQPLSKLPDHLAGQATKLVLSAITRAKSPTPKHAAP